MSEAGEIVGQIKLDGLDKFLGDVDIAEAKVEELTATDPKVKITTEGAAKAIGELEAVKAAEDRVSDSTGKLGKAQADGAAAADKWQGALVGGLVAVSSAAPPVAAGAIAIAGAMGVMGGAGILGLAGIVRGLKENNAVGQEYRGTVDSLTASFHSAEDAAANGLFPGVQKSAALLRQDMPALNSEIDHFGGMLGSMLPTGLDATVTLIERANPLFDAAGRYLGSLVSGLDHWSHSAGYQSFLDYSIRELPQVEHLLGDAGHLVGDFLTAWAPLGSDTLPMLDTLVTSVDDLVKRTGPLVPAAVAVAGAWKLLSPVAGMLSGIVGWTRTLGSTAVTSAAEVNTLAAAEERAAAGGGAAGGGAGLLGKAKGLAGAAAVGAGLAIGDSYETSNIDPQLLGQSSYTKGVAGRSGGAAGIDSALAAMVNSGNAAKAAAQFAQVKTAADKLGMSTKELTGDFPKYTAAVGNAGKATQATVPPVKAATSAYQQLVTQENAAYTAQQKLATSTESLVGTNLSAKDAIDATATALKASAQAAKNGKAAWGENTAAGRANEEQVLSAVQAIQAHGAAINADGQHAAEAAVSNDKMAISLEKTMEQFGVSKPKAEAYVNALLGIPKNVSTEAQLKADEAILKAKQAKQAAEDFKNGNYKGALALDNSPAMRAKVAAAEAAQAFAKGDYKAVLKGNPTPAEKAAAEAGIKGMEFARRQYLATLKANPQPANANSADAARKAHGYAAGFYQAVLRANDGPAMSAIDTTLARLRAIDGTTATVYVSAVAAGVSYARAASINRNSGYTSADGGTITPHGSVRGLADGGSPYFSGTVTGPGNAWNDQAGLWALANTEEVISNKRGQADLWRPALKAMNANLSPAAVLSKVAKIAGQSGRQGPTTVIYRTIHAEPHIHNPVAVDPVQQVIDANQYVLAYSGLG